MCREKRTWKINLKMWEVVISQGSGVCIIWRGFPYFHEWICMTCLILEMQCETLFFKANSQNQTEILIWRPAAVRTSRAWPWDRRQWHSADPSQGARPPCGQAVPWAARPAGTAGSKAQASQLRQHQVRKSQTQLWGPGSPGRQPPSTPPPQEVCYGPDLDCVLWPQSPCLMQSSSLQSWKIPHQRLDQGSRLPRWKPTGWCYKKDS